METLNIKPGPKVGKILEKLFLEVLKDLKVGVNLKIINQSIENEKTLGFSFDIGTLYTIYGVNVGATLQNLGPKMRYIETFETLPCNIKLGASYKLFDKSLTFAVDINKPLYEVPLSMNIGAEYWFKNILSGRIGYTKDLKMESNVGLSFGGGFKYDMYQIDYAFVPFGDLGNSHRVSLSVNF